ncbi:MAG TPA: hybrid sensor histidine kinase/response regulator [Mucilaginibacter sp.]|nr:hybrid sensor histidine kinase/response regulator [Mucilaginibacter sp.]
MSSGGEIKILLVDDTENNLLSMEAILEREGYEIYKAISGREALRVLLKDEDFSLILLDVRMPIMDGYETAELIQQRDKLKHIPIIFITAQDYEDESAYKGYESGGVDFILKPINPEILRAKVRVFAEMQRKNLLLRIQEEKVRAINNDLKKLNRELEQRVSERTMELENLNDELRELNLSKDKFLSVISHDLRNPLTSLLLASKNLNDKVGEISLKETQMFASIIHRTSNKILQQLNELVDWAKEQREKTKFSPERIQLHSRITESLELLRVNAIQKSVKLENNTAHDVYVYADSLMLRSILQNIVTNAIKFTPNGNGVVSVSAQPVNSMIEVCIQDSGVGMSREIRDQLMGSFDVSIPGTNQEKGSGLGLLLVKDFVAQHGGSIAIDSEPGKGTCFRFTVPKYEYSGDND